MSSIEVRPFRRSDREQVTALVNAHVAAVIPGVSVSVNTVLSRLEREPGEFIVDPWVSERATFVGYIEVETLADAGRLARNTGWADIGNLHVGEPHRRRGVATWLVGQAADWLRLARVDRVLDYAWPEQEDCTAFLAKVGSES